MVTAQTIEQYLRRYFSAQYYALSNTYIYSWESDYWFQTKAGYHVEVEIKVSRADFFRDFTKAWKHKLLRERQRKHVAQPTPAHNYYVNNKQVIYTNYPCCSLQYVEPADHLPNRFYYAVPEGLVKAEEVPAYAGLLVLQSKPYGNRVIHALNEVRRAPLLHKQKNNLTPVLLDKFYYLSLKQQTLLRDRQLILS